MSEQGFTVDSETKGARRSKAPDGLRLAAFLRCIFLRRGHDYVNSKSKPGHLTCVRCRYRRRIHM